MSNSTKTPRKATNPTKVAATPKPLSDQHPTEAITPAYPLSYIHNLKLQATVALGNWLKANDAPDDVRNLFSAIDGMWCICLDGIKSKMDNDSARAYIESGVSALAALGSWDTDGAYEIGQVAAGG